MNYFYFIFLTYLLYSLFIKFMIDFQFLKLFFDHSLIHYIKVVNYEYKFN